MEVSLLTSFIPFVKELRQLLKGKSHEGIFEELDYLLCRPPYKREDIIELIEIVLHDESLPNEISPEVFKNIEDLHGSLLAIDKEFWSTTAATTTMQPEQVSHTLERREAQSDEVEPSKKLAKLEGASISMNVVNFKPKPVIVLDFPSLSALSSSKSERKPVFINKIVSSLAVFRNEKSGSRVFYKCFRAQCPFIVLDEKLFTEHLIERHSDVGWNGFCATCMAVVSVNPRATILDEMHHLQWFHVNPQSNAVAENLPMKTKNKAAKAETIKDELVLGPPPPPVEIKIRPWLKEEQKKDAAAATLMIEPNCLSGLFKCMQIQCSYFTSRSYVFETHLKTHFPENDGKGQFDCAYCVFQGSNTDEITKHIESTHKYDSFSCFLCFYRSASASNVKVHFRNHHSDLTVPIIVESIPGHPSRELATLQKLKDEDHLARMAPKMICAFCSEKFYAWLEYENHVKCHPKYFTATLTCQTCMIKVPFPQHTTHFEKCYKIGMQQCLYCRFGTNTLETIESHLADEHPTELPFHCARMGIPGSDPKTVKSLRISYTANTNVESIVVQKNKNSPEVLNVGNAKCIDSQETSKKESKPSSS